MAANFRAGLGTALAAVVLLSGCFATPPDAATKETWNEAELGTPASQVAPGVNDLPRLQIGNQSETGTPISERDEATVSKLWLEVLSHYAILHGAREFGVEQVRVIPKNVRESERDASIDSESGSILVPFLEPSSEYNLTLSGQSWVSFRTPPSARGFQPIGTALIHPGMNFVTDSSSCTLAFLARGPMNDTLFALTAGHCFGTGDLSNAGKARIPGTNEVFGHVVAGQSDAGHDWALIALEPGFVEKATPVIPGLGSPTGASQGPYKFGEEVCHVGHGDVVGAVNPRCGAIWAVYAAGHFAFLGEAYHGDSGSPVIEADTGAAIGVLVAGFYSPVGDVAAYHICTILDALFDSGFPLRILTGTPETPPFEWEGFGDSGPTQQTLDRQCRPEVDVLQIKVG